MRTSTVDDYATSFAYDALNRRVAQIRHSRGAQNADLATSYAYDRRSNVVGIVDPKRNAFGGNPAQNALDPARRRFSYEYDRVDNRIAQVEDPPGLALRTTYGYDADDNRVSLTTPRQFTTRWEYEPRGLPAVQIDAEGNRTERHYRPDGRLAEIVAPKGTASEASSDYETRFDYYPTGDVRSQSLPLDERQYGPQFLRVFWHRNKVGDPICITDARARTGAPDEDCSSRFSFRNTFFDSGQLRSTERPSWWALGNGGLTERDPLDVGNRGGASALPSSGNGEGDFAAVDRLPLPSLVPDAGRTTFAYDNALELSGITDVEGKVAPHRPRRHVAHRRDVVAVRRRRRPDRPPVRVRPQRQPAPVRERPPRRDLHDVRPVRPRDAPGRAGQERHAARDHALRVRPQRAAHEDDHARGPRLGEDLRRARSPVDRRGRAQPADDLHLRRQRQPASSARRSATSRATSTTAPTAWPRRSIRAARRRRAATTRTAT